MDIQLSPRLQMIAEQVPRGAVVADVGTDHGYLLAYLIRQGISPRGVAGDVSAGPLESARQNLTEAGLMDRVTLRLSDGLKDLPMEGVRVVVIAGMGGTTIRDILAASPDRLAHVERLILQPMVAGDALRRWLAENGWALCREELAAEGERLYEIIVAVRGEQGELSDMEALFGPTLLKEGHPLLRRWVEKFLEDERKVLRALEKAKTEEGQRRKAEVARRLEEMEGVIRWLSNAGR